MLLMARSKQLKRLEPWHHQLIDWLLAYPEKSGHDASEHFGVSPVWISIVKHSPVFRAEIERRREMISQAVAADIVGRATALAKLSLDTQNERIERNRDSMPLRQVRDTAELMLRMLGYGATQGRGASPSSVTVKVGHVDSKLLEVAREKMRKHNRMSEKGGA